MKQIMQIVKGKARVATSRKDTIVMCLAWYTLLVMFDFCLIEKMDDSNFRDGIANFGNIFAWMKFWGESWSGRVIPQGMLVLLMQLPDAWFHICNAGAWLVLLLYTWKGFDAAEAVDWRIGIPVTFMAVFVLIPAKILDDSVFWKSANVVYLWGMAAMMAAIYPFVKALKRRRVKRADYVIAILACLYASGVEQCGALMSGIMVCTSIALLLRDQRMERSIVALTAVSCLLTAFFFLLPGNSVRMRAEILGNFQSFDMLSSLDRALLGITYAVGHVESEIPALMALLAVVNLYGMRHVDQKGSLQKMLGWLPAIYFICNFFHQMSRQMQDATTFMSPWFSLVEINTIDFGVSRQAFLAEITNVGMIVLLGMNLAWMADTFDVLSFCFYFGGFATMWLMGFSPTIYASAERPRFIGYYCLLCCLLVEIVHEIRGLLSHTEQRQRE